MHQGKADISSSQMYVLLKKRLGPTVRPYQDQTGKSYEKINAHFDVFYYTFLSTDEKKTKTWLP